MYIISHPKSHIRQSILIHSASFIWHAMANNFDDDSISEIRYVCENKRKEYLINKRGFNHSKEKKATRSPLQIKR